MNTVIQDCNAYFGAAPRSFSLMERFRYLKIFAPTWLRGDRNDMLNCLIDDAYQVFKEGHIVWGHIVQANTLLFERDNNYNCPAALVYSPTAARGGNPAKLGHIARELFALKGTKPTDMKTDLIAEYMTDEMSRPMGIPVPTSIASAEGYLMTTTFIVRKHLPGRTLYQSALPIVVHPQKTHLALPLPERYWPRSLVQQWIG